jgi:sugar transferase (PEP-CTERM/EpsH1 system associated)
MNGTASAADPPLVMHLIYELGTGGLENGLVNIINRSDPARYRHAIVSLTRSGPFADRITAGSVEIVPLHKRPGHDLRVFFRVWRELRRLRPAILHTRNLAAFEMQLVGLLFPRLRKIHGEHGRDVYDLDGTNPRYRLLRKALRPFIDRYITVSRDLERWLVDCIGIRPVQVRQIYNGVDHERFRPRTGGRPAALPAGWLPADGVLIGTVGRLAEVKDQATLLRAFARVVEASPRLRERLRLVLVGDGPLAGSLRALVEELGIGPLVWMPGDRDDVPALLQGMDVFVLPSLAEGISNTILEAMACGLPVLATDTGGNPELVEPGHNGELFPVGDPAALAGRLRRLVEDPARMRRLGTEARDRVLQRFDWEVTVAQYLALYDEVLAA